MSNPTPEQVAAFLANLKNEFFRQRVVQRLSARVTRIVDGWDTTTTPADRAWLRGLLLNYSDDKELKRLARRIKRT